MEEMISTQPSHAWRSIMEAHHVLTLDPYGG